jgi:hypothetical protein
MKGEIVGTFVLVRTLPTISWGRLQTCQSDFDRFQDLWRSSRSPCSWGTGSGWSVWPPATSVSETAEETFFYPIAFRAWLLSLVTKYTTCIFCSNDALFIMGFSNLCRIYLLSMRLKKYRILYLTDELHLWFSSIKNQTHVWWRSNNEMCIHSLWWFGL